MKFDTFAVASLLFLSAPSLAHPQPAFDVQVVREDAAQFEARDADLVAGAEELWKRKGGGGGGGGKGGGGGSSSSSGGSSGSSGGSSGKGGSGSSSSSGGSSSSSGGKSGGKGSSTSTSGGQTKQGSGIQPSFGGGKYYGGGATQPFSTGQHSPLGIVPVFLGVGALTLLPGLWLYGAYSYPYHHPYTFHNSSAHANSTNSTTPDGPTPSNGPTNGRRDPDLNLWERADEGVNQTKPVTCLCAQYAECGCDDSGNTTFLDSLIGDGDYSKLNLSLVNVADVNGTSTIILNGTLPNGTTIPGGTEDANGAVAGMYGLMQSSGYLVMVALAACTVLLV